jgi:hypothetical protein
VQNPWLFYFDLTRMALEAQQVVALRMMRLAEGGPNAALETQRMIGEKVLALWAAQSAAGWAMTRGPATAGQKALAPFKSAVSANRRRLRRSRRRR